jgi:hypothetical protein
MGNKNAISWFMSEFKTKELYKCKYKEVLGEWDEYVGFRVRVTQWNM